VKISMVDLSPARVLHHTRGAICHCSERPYVSYW
jgi:hypothetical protein